MKTIVIDPGHGGNERYNIGYSGKYNEADGNLEFSLALESFLKDSFSVIMTRREDKTVSLRARGIIAVREKADMFISVHSNSFHKKEAKGVTVFQSVDLDNKEIAERIGRGIAEVMNTNFRGVKTKESSNYKGEDYYTVIDVPQDGGIPVVLLIERGFHSNPIEEEKLLDKDNVYKAASKTAEIIKEYFGIKNDENKNESRKEKLIQSIKNIDDKKLDEPITKRDVISILIKILNEGVE